MVISSIGWCAQHRLAKMPAEEYCYQFLNKKQAAYLYSDDRAKESGTSASPKG